MAAPRTERLDQILIRLGFATEAQVTLALQKQHGLGGRLGTHLVYAGHVTEAQLAQALAIQFQVPAYQPARQRPDRALLERLPEGFARRHLVLPLALDAATGVLTLAAVDPRDTVALTETKRMLGCGELALCVIPEVTFERALAETGCDDALLGPRRLIELPELFEGSGDAVDYAAAVLSDAAAREPDGSRVLLLTARAFLGTLLTPLFEREGRSVTVTADPQEAAQLLRRGGIAHVLVSGDMADAWRGWLIQGTVARPRVPVTRLDEISAALLGSVAPYDAMHSSLVGALRLAATRHGEPGAPAPAYELLRRDVRDLAAAMDLERLVVDGLEVAVLVIVPSAAPLADVDALLKDDGTGIDWTGTLEGADLVGFPWPVDGVLAALRQLLSERVNLEEFGRQDPDLALAAQVLALVWHRHQRLGAHPAGAGKRALAIKTDLRQKSGHLARSEVVERYLTLLERGEDELLAPADHQLLLVGRADRYLHQLATRLAHLGYRTLSEESLDVAVDLCDRQTPTAVFVHDASFPGAILGARARLAGDRRLLVYAVTSQADPSQVLNLFDAGFDDVFALPRDLDLVAARLRKALRESAAASPAPVTGRPGAFQAAFTAFAFTDLMQALSQSLKSVRIDLSGPGGEQAVIYLDRGQLTHAASGPLQGGEAVYRIVAWEDNGSFAVEPVTDFPEPNIGLPLESILMEGCRLLDESRL